MKRLTLELLIATMLVVTSGALLYFYLLGYWYDPIAVIEITELVLLMLFIIVELSYVVGRVVGEAKRG